MTQEIICVVNDMKTNKRNSGFTLVEMLLVLVIATSLLALMMNYATQKTDQLRRDRVSLQVQQILSAALSYYVNNGTWPTCGTPPCNFDGTSNGLQSAHLFPAIAMKNPWGQSYYYTSYNNSNNFEVYTNVMKTPIAQTIVGQLPMGFNTLLANAKTDPPTSDASCPSGTNCTYVVSSVTVPGQNLNNARSVNFAGIYHNGACVPAPTCPTGMTPRVFVTPVQVAGAYYAGGANPVVYPVSAFSAYAKGSLASNSTPAATPEACNTGSKIACNGTATLYWRVCLDVITSLGGPVGGSAQGQNETALAMTRCEPTNEPAGSAMTVYSP